MYSLLFSLPLTLYSLPFLPSLFLRTKLDAPSLLHRLCTDFGTEEERRKSGGITDLEPYFPLLG